MQVYNQKHTDSAYLCQGTSYQSRNMDLNAYPDLWSAKFNHLFIGPLPTFPENFIQIRLELFVQSC